MRTSVALLRGINVGGHNKIKMPVLESLFASLGYTDVTTYVQSGNVVFSGAVDPPGDVAGTIEAAIASELGLDVAVIVRTGDELAAVIAGNPFGAPAAGLAKVYVTFLAAAPDPALVDRLEVKGAEPDEFRLRGRDMYLYCPGGYGRTKLNNGLWERRLRVAATTRNWNTVTKLAELALR